MLSIVKTLSAEFTFITQYRWLVSLLICVFQCMHSLCSTVCASHMIDLSSALVKLTLTHCSSCPSHWYIQPNTNLIRWNLFSIFFLHFIWCGQKIVKRFKKKKQKKHEEERKPHPFAPISTSLEVLLLWTASEKINFNNLSKYPWEGLWREGLEPSVEQVLFIALYLSFGL